MQINHLREVQVHIVHGIIFIDNIPHISLTDILLRNEPSQHISRQNNTSSQI